MRKLVGALAIVLSLTPIHLGADAQIADWIGEYAMNHDGHQGTLRIEESKRDCVEPAWCRLVISYVDANGTRHRARIRSIDDAFQHMAFDIGFPGHVQQFEAYLMSWDKDRMAGTTMWQGRTFGFYAFKRGPERVRRPDRRPDALGAKMRASDLAATPQGAEQKTINAQGEVETSLPDGSKKLQRPGACGFTIVRPDGTRTTMQCNQVQPATPPLPDNVSGKWLDAHNSSLLEIIRSLLGNDQASLDNYLRANESTNQTIYDRIRVRTSLITALTSSS